jgi:hypothetical protein
MYVFMLTPSGPRIMQVVRSTVTLRGGKKITLTRLVRPIAPQGSRVVPVSVWPTARQPQRRNPVARNWMWN